MTRYTYLIIDFLTICVPFLFSFHPKILFIKSWKSFIPAMTISATVFLVWDEIFTVWGVWGFNPDYLIGISIGHLPLGEILFFVCIPYSCVFTYFCFKKFDVIYLFNKNISSLASFILIPMLLIVGLYYYEKAYTLSTFILMSFLLFWHQFINKSMN